MTTLLNPRDATFERVVERAIAEGSLLPDLSGPGDAAAHAAPVAPVAPIVVAVSGGPDSMALLHLMLARAGDAARRGEMRRRVIAAHVDHRLRGAASDEDAAFVRTQAVAWGAEAVVATASLPERARTRAAGGAAIEADARRARYAALRDIAEKAGADRVLTAHTADDQAETILLRLVRGAGLRGLAAMAPLSRVQGVRVARPLLSVSRAQVMSYIQRHAIPYRTDATNGETAAARNYVRHEIVPRIEARLNPAVRNALLRAAANFREADDYLERRAARIYRRVRLEGDETKISLDAPRLLLYPKLLRTYVFRRAVRELNGNLRDVATTHLRAIHELADSHRGHTAMLPGGVRVRRERERITLSLDGRPGKRPEECPKECQEAEPTPRRAPSKT